MSVKGFIFDLDGVITDTADYHFEAWKNLASNYGITIDREFNEQLKGISRMDSLNRILEFGGRKTEFTEAQKEAMAAEKNGEYVKLIEKMTPEHILPGVLDFLTELKKHNYLLGLASASKNGPVILERLNLSGYFDTIVDPSLLAKGKPDPEIFLTAARQLGLKPEECIGIEDASAGIESINKAKMFSVGVGDKESMKEANYRLSNTSELSLEKILNRLS
ncbi:beta-phosphoglucomutase [Vagococcus sp. PNs007]|uniref:Beta-phosphoglucomutase n=1 Tax=Vagococcus proximus TaxID=2991417 RepID=A0ABT5WYL6_9ENTE|nr:beta-phosphoglucomutase [Vagococcus proximus]MDF0478848.1 beta-phosphoglucomutase [Vagococcus proximus]